MEDSEFHAFFIDELKDIYWQKHLSKALKMQKASARPEFGDFIYKLQKRQSRTGIDSNDEQINWLSHFSM